VTPAQDDPWAEFTAPPPAAATHGDPWAEFIPAAKPGVGEDVLKGGGIGLAKGAIGIAGLPGDLGNVRDAAVDKLHRWLGRAFGMTPEQVDESVAGYHKAIETPTPFSRFPKALSSGDIQGAIEEKTGPFYEAKTPLGKGAETVASFIPAALTGGGGVAGNILKGAVAPGIASEYAGQKTQGTVLEPWARAAGAVVGGVGAHAADIGRAAAKTYGAQRAAAGEIADLTGEPKITSGAVSRVAKSLADDEVTPASAAARMQELGPDEAMLMDAGRQLQGRAEAIAAQPGRGQNRVLDAVEGRTGTFGEGTAQRVRGTLDTTMGPSPDVVATKKDIADLVAQRAAPLYDAVMGEHPVVNVPADITSRPSVAQAMKNAVSLAKDRGESLVGPTETVTELKGPGYHIAEDVTPKAQTSLRYWDYVKKAMDSKITGMMKSGGIETLDSKEKADLGGMIAARNALRDHLDEATGGAYAQARAVAATKPQLNEALQFGRDSLNTKLLPEELADEFHNMSIPQQSMARVGMRREIQRVMAVANNDGAAARRILDTDQNREKIAAIFGAKQAQAIDNRIAAEIHFQEVTHNVAKNARTQVRGQLIKDTESPSAATPPVANVMGFATKAAGNVLGNIRQSGMESTRNAIGSMMTTPGRDVPDLVRILAGYNERAAANARPPVAPYAKTLANVIAADQLRRANEAPPEDQRLRVTKQ
jgi:hypothetical protein